MTGPGATCKVQGAVLGAGCLVLGAVLICAVPVSAQVAVRGETVHTMAGARMLGLDSRIGTLEAGKDADFIVLSGDPLSVYTHVEQTWVEGTKVFDRANAEDRKVATGGYGALRDEAMDLDGEEGQR